MKIKMKVEYTIIFFLLHYNVFVYGTEVSNLRKNGRKPEKNNPISRKEQAILEVKSIPEANGSNFADRLPSTTINNEETRLLIQWKQAVVDKAASMDTNTTQILQVQESISFSQLLQKKYELVNGNVPTFRTSSENSKNDEAVKVMLDSPQFGITAVAGPSEALEYYDLEHHPAVERVEIDMMLDNYGFIDNPPNNIVNEIGSNGDKRTSSKATRNMQSTDFAPYGITMVQANQIGHNPTNKMRVCVVDTGMDINHQDLPKSPQHGLMGWNHPTEYGNQVWHIDGHGHGTHVSGTIAAMKNNVGLHGVEDDPSRFYLSIGKGLSDKGCGYNSVVLDAVLTCVNTYQAKVVNLSLGSPKKSAIAENIYRQIYDQGVLIVAAAGNSATFEYNYPASYTTVMSVAATDRARAHAEFNTYNHQVEITAPGVRIASTYPNNRYVYMSGTSMASPHVAGVALKVWSWFPECSNTQIRNVLLKSASAVRNSCDVYYGYGIIQAADALQMLRTYGCEAGGITPEPRHLHSPGGCEQLSYMQTRPPTTPPTNTPTAAPTSQLNQTPNVGITGVLPVGEAYYSSNQAYFLIFQSDGNLVIYGPRGAVWSVGPRGNGAVCIMQSDGNLVIYNNGSPTWWSDTHGNPGAYLVLTDTGNLVIYDRSGSIIKYYEKHV